MTVISKIFSRFFNNTLVLNNGVQFAYKGPWVTVAQNTIIDSWFIGEFMAADYTIAIDHNLQNKEIIKCCISATADNADLLVYGRTSVSNNLINLSATVDNSRCFLIANPAIGLDGSTVMTNSKLIFSANYYKTLNEPSR
jgi:hypothetical protein